MTSEMRLRVLLVDDHAVVREGYRRLLERTSDIEVLAEAANGDAASRLAAVTLSPKRATSFSWMAFASTAYFFPTASGSSAEPSRCAPA